MIPGSKQDLRYTQAYTFTNFYYQQHLVLFTTVLSLVIIYFVYTATAALYCCLLSYSSQHHACICFSSHPFHSPRVFDGDGLFFSTQGRSRSNAYYFFFSFFQCSRGIPVHIPRINVLLFAATYVFWNYQRQYQGSKAVVYLVLGWISSKLILVDIILLFHLPPDNVQLFFNHTYDVYLNT